MKFVEMLKFILNFRWLVGESIKINMAKDVYKPSVYGFGYIGEGVFKVSNGKSKTYHYRKWSSMLERCYSDKLKIKFPTYESCIVCEEWHNFQKFSGWLENQKGVGLNGWELDKDILVRNNKLYSSDTCVLIPRQINNLLKDRKKISNLPVGVTYTERDNLYIARCYDAEGKRVVLGYFRNEEAASKVYADFKKKVLLDVAKIYLNIVDDRVISALKFYSKEGW